MDSIFKNAYDMELKFIYQHSRCENIEIHNIDNIFSNNIQDEVISGNILLTLSEQFSQSISVKRERIDIKKVNIYWRDYSTFFSK